MVTRMPIAKHREKQKTVLLLASRVERLEPCALLGTTTETCVHYKSHHTTQQFCFLASSQRDQKQGLEERLEHPRS